jgi:hypothetical protein
MLQREFSMSEFAIGAQVEKAAGDREPGTVVAVLPAVDRSLEYAADADGFGAFTLTRRSAA